MLFLDPNAKFLNNTMITSVWFPCLQYWSHPEAPLIFPVFLSGDVVLIQQAKGLRHGVLWYATSAEFHIAITCHFPDLVSASAWLKQIFHAARPIRRITQIWVMTRRRYGFFALHSYTSFRRKTSCGVVKCRLFSQAISNGTWRSDNRNANENVAKRYTSQPFKTFPIFSKSSGYLKTGNKVGAEERGSRAS